MANETMNLNTPILTLDSDTVLETAQSKADLIWHDIQNAYRTRKILTGILGGIPISTATHKVSNTKNLLRDGVWSLRTKQPICVESL